MNFSYVLSKSIRPALLRIKRTHLICKRKAEKAKKLRKREEEAEKQENKKKLDQAVVEIDDGPSEEDVPVAEKQNVVNTINANKPST
jgi:hypothetical protein